MTAIDEAVALIKPSSRIAIATHVSPDPDAIGSLLGLGKGLQSLGKEVVMLSDDPPPSQLDFLPGVEEVVQQLPEGFVPELFIGIDASDPQRLGQVALPLLSGAIPVLNIDHHITNVNFGRANVVSPEASATAEVITLLFSSLHIRLNAEIAECLLTGLIGDTRGFSTPSVTAQTLEVAAQLVRAGANMSLLTERVMNWRSLDMLRVWGIALSNIHSDNTVIWATIPLSERKRINARAVSDTGLSSLLLSVPDASITAVFTEQANDKVDVSMRARPGFEVATAAFSLGGGGHPLAAGCTVDGTLDSTVERVLPMLLAAANPQENQA